MKIRLSMLCHLGLLVLLFWISEARDCNAQTGKPTDTTCGDGREVSNGNVVRALINGRAITEKEIDDSIGSQLYPLQVRIYQLRKRALEDLAVQLVLKSEAEKRGVTVEQLRRQLAFTETEVSEAEVDRAYVENLEILERMNEDEAKQRIRLEMESGRKLDRYKAAVAQLLSRAKVETFLLEPVPPSSRIGADGPSQGPANAAVTVVEYSDFQCPYCKQAAVAVKSLLQGYGSKIRFVFKHLPLSIHPDAFNAAQASVCAGEQARFWEYHDLLFSSSDLSDSTLKKYGVQLGLNMNEFDSCLAAERSAAIVRRNMHEAARADVQGTPTFLINGRIVRGVKDAGELKELVDQALRQKLIETPASPR